MTIEYDAAAHQLERLQREVTAVPREQHIERLVRLTNLARVLLEAEGPIGHATLAVANEFPVDHLAMERTALQGALAEVLPALRGLAVETHSARALVDESTMGPLRKKVQWRDQTMTVGKVLAEIRDGCALSALTINDALSLRDVLPGFCDHLTAQTQLSGDEPASVERRRVFAELHDRAVQVARVGYARIHEAGLAQQFANASDHNVTLHELRRLVTVDTAIRTGGDSAKLATLAEIANELEDLTVRSQRLVFAVCSRLLSSRQQIHVVARLRTWLERFKARELLERMTADSANAERILQTAVDEFLFQSGLYPLTHFVAGAGHLDTFAELLADDRGLREGSGSVLVELKQAVTRSSRADVRSAAIEGIVQARAYSAHVRSHPRWSDHQVFCLVVYAGPKRFHLDARTPAQLIYIGRSVPSAGSELIELPEIQ